MSRSQNSSKGSFRREIGFTNPFDTSVVWGRKGKRWAKRFASKHRRLWARQSICRMSYDELFDMHEQIEEEHDSWMLGDPNPYEFDLHYNDEPKYPKYDYEYEYTKYDLHADWDDYDCEYLY